MSNMSLDGLWYIQSKIDAREEKGLQPIPYSRPETSQPSRDLKIPKPSKKTPLSHLKSDDASTMTSSTASSSNSTMALLKEKMHRSNKDNKDNKKYFETDAINSDESFDTPKEKREKRKAKLLWSYG